MLLNICFVKEYINNIHPTKKDRKKIFPIFINSLTSPTKRKSYLSN